MTRLRIGDPNLTVTGLHRYLVEYPLDGLASGGMIKWQAVGPAWTVPIDRTEIRLAVPWALRDPRCVTNDPAGCAITQPEPGLLVIRPGNLDAHQSVTIHASAGAALDRAPRLTTPDSTSPAVDSAQGPPILLVGLLVVATALLGAMTASVLIRRLGREHIIGDGTVDQLTPRTTSASVTFRPIWFGSTPG